MSKQRIIFNKILAVFLWIFFYFVLSSRAFESIDNNKKDIKDLQREINKSCLITIINNHIPVYKYTSQCNNLLNEIKRKKTALESNKKILLYITLLYFGVPILIKLIDYINFTPLKKFIKLKISNLKSKIIKIFQYIKTNHILFFRLSIITCTIYTLLGMAKYQIWKYHHYGMDKFILYYLIPSILIIGIIWLLSPPKK